MPKTPETPCFRSFFPGNELWLTRAQTRRLDLLMVAAAAGTAVLWWIFYGGARGLALGAGVLLVGWAIGKAP